MPEKRHCICGKDYWWPSQRWQHSDCPENYAIALHASGGVIATNRGSASNHASNGEEVKRGRLGGVERRLGQVVDCSGGGEGVVGRKQRWSRDKYNAYQREYMRKKRALGRD